MSYNLGYVPLVAALVVVGATANAPLHIHLPTLGQILAAAFPLLSPDYDVVPLRPLLPVAFGVIPDFGSGDGEARHCPAISGKAHFRIFAEIADKDCFINRHGTSSEKFGVSSMEF